MSWETGFFLKKCAYFCLADMFDEAVSKLRGDDGRANCQENAAHLRVHLIGAGKGSRGLQMRDIASDRFIQRMSAGCVPRGRRAIPKTWNGFVLDRFVPSHGPVGLFVFAFSFSVPRSLACAEGFVSAPNCTPTLSGKATALVSLLLGCLESHTDQQKNKSPNEKKQCPPFFSSSSRKDRRDGLSLLCTKKEK